MYAAKQLIDSLVELVEKMKIETTKFEFQVLYGVPMNGKLEKLISKGYKVRIYVPFGPDWYEYSLRRLKENPNIASINASIQGNKALPPLAERLPEEPLVVRPYDSIGKYGGTIKFLSKNFLLKLICWEYYQHVLEEIVAKVIQVIRPNVFH